MPYPGGESDHTRFRCAVDLALRSHSFIDGSDGHAVSLEGGVVVRRINRALRAITLSVLTTLALGVSALSASPAHASPYTYSNVYVSYPTWLGNCPGGGSV